VLEPDLASVKKFEPAAPDAEPRSNLEVAGWRDKLLPSSASPFAGVLAYFDALPRIGFGKEIMHDADRAWRSLRRTVIWPRRRTVDALMVEDRSRDFGRSETSSSPHGDLTPGIGRRLANLRTSFWREGEIVRSFPLLHPFLLTGLECAYFGVPTVAIYKAAWSDYLIARQIVRVKHLAMPNLLAGEEIYPEFIQHKAAPDNIARATLNLLNHPELQSAVKARLAEVTQSLGKPGASQRAARAVLELLPA